MEHSLPAVSSLMVSSLRIWPKGKKLFASEILRSAAVKVTFAVLKGEVMLKDKKGLSPLSRYQ